MEISIRFWLFSVAILVNFPPIVVSFSGLLLFLSGRSYSRLFSCFPIGSLCLCITFRYIDCLDLSIIKGLFLVARSLRYHFVSLGSLHQRLGFNCIWFYSDFHFFSKYKNWGKCYRNHIQLLTILY
jgi:hypothetical protein